MTSDFSLMPTVIALMERLDAHLRGLGAHDNQRCVGLWLKLWGDGSGCVMAEYVDVKDGDDADRAMVRTVMSMAPTELIAFDTLAELHGELVAMTMRVPRGDSTEPAP